MSMQQGMQQSVTRAKGSSACIPRRVDTSFGIGNADSSVRMLMVRKQEKAIVANKRARVTHIIALLTLLLIPWRNIVHLG